MNERNGVIECVVNINHDHNASFMDNLVHDINATGAWVAHRDSGIDASRTVLTLLSYMEYMPEVLQLIYGRCSIVGSIHSYSGNHPSTGIVDVVPFVPLTGSSREVLCDKIRLWADLIADSFGIPILFYGAMASSADQVNLSQIRKGGIKKAEERLRNGLLKVDVGPKTVHQSLGISCWTMREVMIAYNVSLDCQKIDLIKSMASEIRQRRVTDPALKNVRVLGWLTPHYGCGQISANLYDPNEMTMQKFYDMVREVAWSYGITVLGSELIGMTPLGGISHGLTLEEIDAKVEQLGLSYHKPFDITNRLLDHAIERYFRQD